MKGPTQMKNFLSGSKPHYRKLRPISYWRSVFDQCVPVVKLIKSLDEYVKTRFCRDASIVAKVEGQWANTKSSATLHISFNDDFYCFDSTELTFDISEDAITDGSSTYHISSPNSKASLEFLSMLEAAASEHYANHPSLVPRSRGAAR
jgi:hypothetical protein